ncbi:beta-ketoacyl-[acyl-carrier-protein] synthase family protein [Cryobacterium sp. TMT1-21]|nr:beta-ketoacyl-[acyl-carrier-protein] synthase family protein [Cryobacterium sp. TMT4-10]TFD18148.1 beta-ketoacyl-[acyl-carrier-protein] synthase family protein [Cryobacterium sp. TMT1-21]TFD24984.1 beta-ketoacyl-[acyl-carrier-protein] synthase family protein [Cryobacterium sp. TMT2-23]TFD40057.1 beta-ketoacyl-[acyl-carrier-protein] synthase family protein [Cryobacterium sp. TMT2-10]
MITVNDRVVITGLGALTPLGNNWRDTWSGLTNGRSGVARITQFDPTGLPTQIAGEVKNFIPADHMAVKQVKRASRSSQLAIAAAREAVADAGFGTSMEGIDTAVVVNSAVSGFAEIQEATELVNSGDSRRIPPRFVPSALLNMAACEVAIDLGIHGPVNASALACASGAYALLEARTMLIMGDADVVIAGGVEAAITPVMFAGLNAMHAASTNNDSPAEASRPFDADRNGLVFGEGAVVFVMELLSHARARGAQIYAEVLGGALTSDGHSIVAPEPTGKFASLAMTRALIKSKLNPSDIDMICAHGTSTQANDRAETSAIRQALGQAADSIAVTAPKSMTGHMIGAAGALSGLLCALSIRTGIIPPTINYTTPDPDCTLDYVPRVAREKPVKFALANAFGFGGQNCIVAFGAL